MSDFEDAVLVLPMRLDDEFEALRKRFLRAGRLLHDAVRLLLGIREKNGELSAGIFEMLSFKEPFSCNNAPPIHGLSIHEKDLVVLRYDRHYPFEKGLMEMDLRQPIQGNFCLGDELDLDERYRILSRLIDGEFILCSFEQGSDFARQHG